jgi:16S rRNA (guanine527-N7)-methyltransferase
VSGPRPPRGPGPGPDPAELPGDHPVDGTDPSPHPTPVPDRAGAPAEVRATVVELLGQAQRIGLLGPGPVEEHLEQALAFAAVIGAPPERFADLGSGAGVPGLVLATVAWPASQAVLIESQHRRIHHLRRAVEVLGCADRVTVYGGRAEDAGRRELREQCDVVVARSFGPPAVVAECAVALLRAGGSAFVSEPPATSPTRWPSDILAELGFRPAEILIGPTVPVDGRDPHPVRVARLVRTGPLLDRWPRTPGALRKRPLWRAG